MKGVDNLFDTLDCETSHDHEGSTSGSDRKQRHHRLRLAELADEVSHGLSMGTTDGVIEQTNLRTQTTCALAHLGESGGDTAARPPSLILQVVKVRLNLAHVRSEL